MSYMEWGFNIQTIDRKEVEKVANKELSELDILIEDDWTEFARSITSGEEDVNDTYMFNIIMGLEQELPEDQYNDYYKKIIDLWNTIVSKFKQSTGASLNLFASTADLARCDIDEDEYNFIIDNLYIVNESISADLINKTCTKNIVQGG